VRTGAQRAKTKSKLFFDDFSVARAVSAKILRTGAQRDRICRGTCFFPLRSRTHRIACSLTSKRICATAHVRKCQSMSCAAQPSELRAPRDRAEKTPIQISKNLQFPAEIERFAFKSKVAAGSKRECPGDNQVWLWCENGVFCKRRFSAQPHARQRVKPKV